MHDSESRKAAIKKLDNIILNNSDAWALYEKPGVDPVSYATYGIKSYVRFQVDSDSISVDGKSALLRAISIDHSSDEIKNQLGKGIKKERTYKRADNEGTLWNYFILLGTLIYNESKDAFDVKFTSVNDTDTFTFSYAGEDLNNGAKGPVITAYETGSHIDQNENAYVAYCQTVVDQTDKIDDFDKEYDIIWNYIYAESSEA